MLAELRSRTEQRTTYSRDVYRICRLVAKSDYNQAPFHILEYLRIWVAPRKRQLRNLQGNGRAHIGIGASHGYLLDLHEVHYNDEEMRRACRKHVSPLCLA